MSEWSKCFAWLPVYVDAYTDSEIRNGKMRFRVWFQTVERRLVRRADGDYEDNGPDEWWVYRLPQ